MSDVLGFSALIFVSVIFLTFRFKGLGFVIFVALVLRTAAALMHFYVLPLPDGTADALSFEHQAWDWGQDGLLVWLHNFPGINSFTYSWFVAFFYAVLDRSPLMIQATSVFAGVLSVVYAWKLAMLLWGREAAKRAAWLVALFPMLIQYSALTMREAWITLFLLMALLSIARWVPTNSLFSLLKAIFFLSLATVMHGGLFVALMAFLFMVFSRSVKSSLVRIPSFSVQPKAIFFIFIFLGFFVILGLVAPSIPKLGNVFNVFSFDVLNHYLTSRVRDSAAYPSWTQPSSAADMIWAIPLRGLYLLFSPFPWDIRTPGHIVGMVDAIFYIVIAFLLLKNLKAIRSSPMAMSVLYVLLALIFAFGVGTGNFGTAIRHRAKFVIALIVLAAPKIKNLKVR